MTEKRLTQTKNDRNVTNRTKLQSWDYQGFDCKIKTLNLIFSKYSNNFVWDVIRFHFSRCRYVIDLQFWPVIDINKVRWLAKFLISHLFDWYFTDWSVNYLYCWIFNELVGEILWNFPCTQPLLIKIHRYISKIQMIVVL